MRRIAGITVMVIAWLVVVVGAFIFVDGFLPSRSQGLTPSWAQVAMGAAACGIGFGLRWAGRAINGLTGACEVKKDVSEHPPGTYFRHTLGQKEK